MSNETTDEGSFSIKFDQSLSRITIEIMGLWQHSTVDRWEAALIALLSKEKKQNHDLRLLVDIRHRAIHSSDVASRVQARIAWVASQFTRVAVIIPESILVTFQSRRLAASGGGCEQQRFFGASGIAEAEAWLMEGVQRGSNSPLPMARALDRDVSRLSI